MEDRSFIQQSTKCNQQFSLLWQRSHRVFVICCRAQEFQIHLPLAAGYSAHLLGPSWLYRRIQQIRRKAGMPAAAPSTRTSLTFLATRQASIVIRGDRYVRGPELMRAVWGAGARNSLPLDALEMGGQGYLWGGRQYEYERAGEQQKSRKSSLLGMFCVDDIRWNLRWARLVLVVVVPGILTRCIHQ